MNRSVERAVRVAALSAAFASSAAKTAFANTVASPQPTVVELARQIAAQPTKPAKTEYTASFSRNLPHGERATVTLGASALRGHKPSPAAATYVDIEITSAKAATSPAPIVPLESITFIKQPDGQWSAHSEAAIPGSAHTSANIEVLDGKTVRQYDQSVGPHAIRNSNMSVSTDPTGAARLFNSLEVSAEGCLQDILHGRMVEQ